MCQIAGGGEDKIKGGILRDIRRRDVNIQPGNSSGRKKTSLQRQNGTQNGAVGGLFVRVVRMAAVVLVAGAFFHTYIKFDQEINVASAEIEAINQRLKDLDLQIQVLDNRYEECCTLEFIERQIARFNLPLVELRQDQQIVMHLYSKEQLARLAASRRSYYRTAENNRFGKR